MLNSAQRRKRWFESVVEGLEELIGHRPTEAEVADGLGLTIQDLRLLVGEPAGGPDPELERCPDSCWQDEEEFMEIDPAVDAVQPISTGQVDSADSGLAATIRDWARRLPPLHQKVLDLYYFKNLRLPEIAEACGQPEELIALTEAECIQVIHRAAQEFAGRCDQANL